MKKILSAENKALLSELVRTDFKLRYQGSLLGYVWSLLKPLLLFVILYVVFVYFLNVGKGVPYFPVYLLLGIVLWNFFTEMTSQSLTSIVGRGDLIRKIRIPRWMIVLSSSISAVINLLLSLIIVFIFLVINQIPLTVESLFLPVYIIILYILAFGISLFLAAVYVKFRDMSYIWEVILQAGFYATPIIYPVQVIHNSVITKVLLLNPIAFSIQGARHSLVTNQAITTNSAWGDSLAVLIPLIIVVIFFLIGLFYFKSRANSFAEDI